MAARIPCPTCAGSLSLLAVVSVRPLTRRCLLESSCHAFDGLNRLSVRLIDAELLHRFQLQQRRYQPLGIARIDAGLLLQVERLSEFLYRSCQIFDLFFDCNLWFRIACVHREIDQIFLTNDLIQFACCDAAARNIASSFDLSNSHRNRKLCITNYPRRAVRMRVGRSRCSTRFAQAGAGTEAIAGPLAARLRAAA